MSTPEYEIAVSRLRDLLAARTNDPPFKGIAHSSGPVLARFQPIFAPTSLPKLTAEDFRSFLAFENNRHWTGLSRQAPRLCADIGKLRSGLAVLLDEGRPLPDRFDDALGRVDGLGKGIATAILMISDPAGYGVWNGTSEYGLKAMNIWPHFNRGESAGKRYVTINLLLHELSRDLGLDLWTLDALWWLVPEGSPESPENPPPPVDPSVLADSPMVTATPAPMQRFGLERHLHEFLRDNWDKTELGREWEIYREEGDDQAGYEYPCSVGRIDLLAKHRSKPIFMVVELKRDQSTDATVGQVLRYMGWVKAHLATANEEVRGMIIAHQGDDALRYALEMVPGTDLRLYEVQFRLHTPEPGPGN